MSVKIYDCNNSNDDLLDTLTLWLKDDVNNHLATLEAEKKFKQSYGFKKQERVLNNRKNLIRQHNQSNKRTEKLALITFADYSISYHRDKNKYIVLVDKEHASYWHAIRKDYTSCIDFIFNTLEKENKLCLLKHLNKKG